jgi:hypothetical protein
MYGARCRGSCSSSRMCTDANQFVAADIPGAAVLYCFLASKFHFSFTTLLVIRQVPFNDTPEPFTSAA